MFLHETCKQTASVKLSKYNSIILSSIILRKESDVYVTAMLF